MSKRNVLILVLLAVALTCFSTALSRRDSRDWRANRSRRLFPFPWQDAAAIRIAKPDGTVLEFFKDQTGNWQIRLPDNLSDTLSNWVVDELTALATLTWREPMRDGKAPTPGRETAIVATSASGMRLELELGETSNNLRAVTIDGDDSVVYGVSQDFLKFLDWPAERFRNFTLANAGTGQRPDRIVLSPAGNDPELRIELRLEADGWRQREPVDWPADAIRVDMLLRWIDRLRADGIEAELFSDLDWLGFTPESASVEVHYPGPDGGRIRHVQFGGDAGEGKVYAKERSRNPVFTVPASTLAEISLDAAASYPELWKNFYRRRAINAIGEEAPLELTVERLLPEPGKLTIFRARERGVEKWKGRLEDKGTTREFEIDPPDPGDAGRPLSALLTGLSSIRVRSFLADTPPGTATARWTAFPAWRFTSKSVDGRNNHEVTLYAADADGNLPPGRPFVEGKNGAVDMTAPSGSRGRAGIAFVMDDTPAVMEMHGDLAYLLCLPLYRYQAARLLDDDPAGWSRVEIVTPSGRTVYTRTPREVNEQWWRGGRREGTVDGRQQSIR